MPLVGAPFLWLVHPRAPAITLPPVPMPTFFFIDRRSAASSPPIAIVINKGRQRGGERRR
uniref:Uncharacterized protein n=1 Tax=Oryza meridionalis TaxID=40149 RepID=A0A0E0DN49_9ORYZ